MSPTLLISFLPPVFLLEDLLTFTFLPRDSLLKLILVPRMTTLEDNQPSGLV